MNEKHPCDNQVKETPGTHFESARKTPIIVTIRQLLLLMSETQSLLENEKSRATHTSPN